MAKIERQHQAEQDCIARGKNFEEVAQGFSAEQAQIEASRCLNCKNSPCKQGCPVKVNIPEFIAQVKAGNIQKAYEIIKETSNLPAICGRVCPQENQCEKYCIRAKMEGAVSIGTLERFVADSCLNLDLTSEKPKAIGKKVAVVGSGPAGLTCAGDLAKAGFDVTIFEAFHKSGGVLVYGIPEFRLPKKLVQKEIDGLAKSGVKIVHNVVIGKTITMQQLEEEFDAIFVGTGAGLPQFLRITGENLCGVFSANEYLTRVNLMKAYQKDAQTPLYPAKNVIVVGAGNVAMDAARTALRCGAEKVTIVYRRTKEEMPARKEELRHAEEEGIEFRLLTNPVSIYGEGKVEGMNVVKMELGELDASGRRKPIEVPNSEYQIPCDMVLVALGTSPNPLLTSSCKELKTQGKGTIVVNEETNQTSIDNVFAGGDAVTGAATVILAMGAGKLAAKSICQKFGVEVKE